MTSISEESIRCTLKDIYSAIKSAKEKEILTGPSQNLEEPFHRLDVLASQDVEERVVNALIRDVQLRPVLEAVARFRITYSLRLEVEQARSILGSSDPWDTLKGYAFYPNYLLLGKMEYQGANLKAGDRVVFLGSGPLPLSLIVLCQEYGLKGIGIERIPEWADLSRKVLDRLALSPQIEIEEGDHFSFPLEEECQLIMVAAAAQPKEEIFCHLARVLPPGTKVSYRIYEKGLRRLLDFDSSFDVPAGFREHLRLQPKPPVNNTAVFLIGE
jgi:hypothetical protein